jgi:ketosteroid isomerase-like protein
MIRTGAPRRRNIEIVRRVLEAADSRDGPATFAHYDPRIEWDTSALPAAHELNGVFRGHEALRAWLREWVSAWEITDYEHEDLIEAGEHVVHFLRGRVRGRLSGIEFDLLPYAQVWTLRDGLVTRMKLYASRPEALEAVGISDSAIFERGGAGRTGADRSQLRERLEAAALADADPRRAARLTGVLFDGLRNRH